jgi:type IV pilus assembly protein PilA
MVVVLIIAILIAVAIPTFLGARTRAQDRAAQSNLRNTLAAAKTLYTDQQSFLSASVAALGTAEPSLTYQAAASGAPNQVSVTSPATTAFVAAALSSSGKCFLIRDDTGTGTQFASQTSGTCVASSTPTWSGKW